MGEGSREGSEGLLRQLGLRGGGRCDGGDRCGGFCWQREEANSSGVGRRAEEGTRGGVGRRADRVGRRAEEGTRGYRSSDGKLGMLTRMTVLR